ncbi:MAG: tRNA (5-methylaminomethyl-2-thiouridine)(34)-methyltransferase MnmD [Saprospiraceae bacterium]|nr:tRNA (5-methylaminomethyl-2-thiouridine)(34)-methyltransferase MnmD [Saprospiraceae bacterium]
MATLQPYQTKDGSFTLFNEQLDEHYHSIHGAHTESQHVFIEAALNYFVQHYSTTPISILEMGFGTGLNAWLSQEFAHNHQRSVAFTSLEAYPLSLEQIQPLDYPEGLYQLHEVEWEQATHLTEFFSLTKKKSSLHQWLLSEDLPYYDIIYYDAFAPSAQPELWTKEVFAGLYAQLNKNGVLTTYCAKGQVKRDLKAVGFTVENLPGPPGKREMTRAIKS